MELIIVLFHLSRDRDYRPGFRQGLTDAFIQLEEPKLTDTCIFFFYYG